MLVEKPRARRKQKKKRYTATHRESARSRGIRRKHHIVGIFQNNFLGIARARALIGPFSLLFFTSRTLARFVLYR